VKGRREERKLFSNLHEGGRGGGVGWYYMRFSVEDVREATASGPGRAGGENKKKRKASLLY